jgi:hypothetical protein
VALGQVLLEYFGFSWQMLRTHQSSRAGIIGLLVANVSSGLSLSPPHKINKKHVTKTYTSNIDISTLELLREYTRYTKTKDCSIILELLNILRLYKVLGGHGSRAV